MATLAVEDLVREGDDALLSGEWERARAAFEAVLREEDLPVALDGLGRALWWLRDTSGAIAYRERAYAAFRRDGELARAARLALWLSREYALVWGNEAAANGWLARAERLLVDTAPGAERGWIALARSERTANPEVAASLAREALEVALAVGDPDLELRALAQLGVSEVSLGRVEEGLAHFDEAMAAAIGGEATALETFADVCCSLLVACELAGDEERPKQWSQIVDAFVAKYDHVPLLAFCRSCCADVYAANGRTGEAEAELMLALRELNEAGQRARCVQPAARLAELRVAQGRFDEAEQLLIGFEETPEAVQAAVALRLARGEPQVAATLLEQRLAEIGRTSLLAAPLLAQLVEAHVAAADIDAAAAAAADLQTIGTVPGRERALAAATLARGRVAAARGDLDAPLLLQEAVNLFARFPLPLEAARARLALAQALAASRPEVAIDVARRAHAELEAYGMTREAALAAAQLRSLGAKARSGPRAQNLLTKRESEVLALVGEGLTNAGIAQRLFISAKTAEHHVGRIYRKLGLTSRGEAAAWAVKNLGRD
jgi:DNA-binding CsgD family transcriptional regulator